MKKIGPKISPFWEERPLLGEEEIYSELAERRGTSLFLGKYSLTEVMAVLGKKGFFKEARKRHLWPLDFEMDSSAFPLQRFIIYYREKKPETIIVDLKIKEGVFVPKNRTMLGYPIPDLRCLMMEWLTLQNPLLSFSGDKTPLPGQTHPGLSLSKKVMDLFLYLAKLTRQDALLAFPAYFHNAVLFSRYFRFLNPEKQAEVLSIHKAFPRVPLKQLAWIVHLNCLRDSTGGIYEWKAEEQFAPLVKPLRAYLDSKRYKDKVKAGLGKFSFSIDWDTFNKKYGGSGQPVLL